ncbi:hypothetical protein NKH18_46425 [Streptomyces sp. M10(2022)]
MAYRYGMPDPPRPDPHSMSCGSWTPYSLCGSRAPGRCTISCAPISRPG